MSPAILVFSGAPESSSLSWKEPDILDTFGEPFCRFSQNADHLVGTTKSTVLTPSASTIPSWRSLPLERQHLTSGLSQSNTWANEYREASFFTTSSISSSIEEQSEIQGEESQEFSVPLSEEALSQFYEQSHATHEDVSLSQIPVSRADGSFNVTGTSFDTSESSFASVAGEKDIPISGLLTNLKDIPNAAYLHSIQPQTMTVNIIVGVISVPPPRAIKTRRGANVELIEILVGDETKSGFGISFWLSSSQSVETYMGGIINALRPQDIVLIRNVALNSFRGKVYGQNLRNDVTKVHLIYRNRIDKTDIGGCYTAADLAVRSDVHSQLEKASKVTEWVLKFVGVAAGCTRGKGGGVATLKEVLPLDTQ